MIRDFVSKLPLPVRDLLALLPPEYVLLVEANLLSLIRVGFRGSFEVLDSVELDPSDSEQSLSSGLLQVGKSPLYHGQPVSVIISRREVRGFIKFSDQSQLGKLYETVKYLKTEEGDLGTCLTGSGEHRLFVAQATDANLLDLIRSGCEDAQLNVVLISSFIAMQVPEITAIGPKRKAITSFKMPSGSISYVVTDGSGSVVVGEESGKPGAKIPREVTRQIREAYFDAGTDVEIRAHDSAADTREPEGMEPLGRLIRNSVGKLRKYKKLVYGSGSSRRALGLKTSLNSLRLLIMVLLVAFVVSSLTAGITGLMAIAGSEPTEEFQTQYATKLTLEQNLANLRAQQDALVSGRPRTKELAPLMSAFFQRRFDTVHLTRISLSVDAHDSTWVEVRGVARNENSIFRYHEALASYLEPYHLALSSIKPEIRNTRGGSDTTITFKLNLVTR